MKWRARYENKHMQEHDLSLNEFQNPHLFLLPVWQIVRSKDLSRHDDYDDEILASSFN
jgi:hypothetical protein